MATDIIARALALQGVRVTSSHQFASNAERDAYFGANPDDLVENMYITVGNTMQQRQGDTWVDVTPVIKGEKGDAGAKGDKGDTGEPGEDGKDGTDGINGTDGTDATINGKTSIIISAGNDIEITDTVDGIEISSTATNIVTSVNTQVGDVVLDKDDIGLGNVDNTSDIDKPISTLTQTEITRVENLIPTKTSQLTNDSSFVSDANYVHTDNNFTDDYKDKIDGIEDGAQVNPDLTPYALKSDIDTALDGKQDILTAGNNISITKVGDETIISSTGGGGGGAVDSVNGQTGVVVLEKDDIGLGNVDNTSDLSKPISNSTQAALQNKADLVGGVVPANQLPSYLDDVLEFANYESFPATGERGKVYIALDTNKTYRWGTTTYVQLDSGLVLGETSESAYRGDRGKIAYDHTLSRDNPHEVTKEQVGLGNVDNTSDLDKPISTLIQTALDGKQDELESGVTIKTINNQSLLGSGNIDVTGGGVISQATETTLGGIKARSKTTETMEVFIDDITGILFSEDPNTITDEDIRNIIQ